MTGVMLRMSYEAITWVLRDAPDVPAQCIGVLVGLAHHADKAGRGACPSAGTLASYARKSKRQVQYDLALLTDLKLIRSGDQAIAARYPVNRRPAVYDLAMERSAGVQPASQSGVQSTAGVQSGSPLQPTAPQTSPDLPEHAGVQSTAPQVSELLGCNGAQPGVQSTAPKPTTKENEKTSVKNQNPAREDGALFDAESVAASKPAPRSRGPKPKRFDEWYRAYPLHKDRGDAEKAYEAAVRAGSDEQDLIDGAVRYRQDPKVLAGYIKGPGRWLRAKCWLDEAAPEVTTPNGNQTPGGTGQASRPSERYGVGFKRPKP